MSWYCQHNTVTTTVKVVSFFSRQGACLSFAGRRGLKELTLGNRWNPAVIHWLMVHGCYSCARHAKPSCKLMIKILFIGSPSWTASGASENLCDSSEPKSVTLQLTKRTRTDGAPMNGMPMWSHYKHHHLPLAAPGGYVFRIILASIAGELLRPAILHRVPHLLLCHQCYMTLAKIWLWHQRKRL